MVLNKTKLEIGMAGRMVEDDNYAWAVWWPVDVVLTSILSG